jgi:type II secretory pathway pseudopilin PulG
VSLVELVIVLACASIIVAAAVPNLHRLQQEWTLVGGARTVESSLHWGRAYAVSTNNSLMFEVDEDGGGFHWTDPESGEPYGSTIRRLPGRVRIVSAPRRPLRFYQRGNAAPAGTYELQGEVGTYRVIVSPAGRIRIQRN